MRKYLLLLLVLVMPGAVKAQDEALIKHNLPVHLKFEARGEYDHEAVKGETVDENTGLRGYILDVKLEGDISRHFSYKYRQRLNMMNKNSSFFDSVDWLYLQWAPTKNFSLMAGKWVVLTGSWECEPPPVDIFQVSEFAMNRPAYQWGLVGNLTTNDKRSTVMLQFAQSPYRDLYQTTTGKGAQMFAYSAVWDGNYGPYHALWSVNFDEYEPGKFQNLLALGNRINLGEHVQCDIDFMNRYAPDQSFFLKDWSIAGKLSYMPNKRVKVWARASYDGNKSGTDHDKALLDGTSLTRVGGGIEYYPLKNDQLRLHGHYSYTFGENTNPNGVLKSDHSQLSLGVTWIMKVL